MIKIAADLFLAAYATLMAVVMGSLTYHTLRLPRSSYYFAVPLWEQWMLLVALLAIPTVIVLFAGWMWRQVWLDVRALQAPVYDDVPFDL